MTPVLSKTINSWRVRQPWQVGGVCSPVDVVVALASPSMSITGKLKVQLKAGFWHVNCADGNLLMLNDTV
jgi:hypothetical protein